MEQDTIIVRFFLLLLRLFIGYILGRRKYRLARYKLVRVQMNLLVHLLDRNSYDDIRCTFHVPIWWFGRRKLMQAFDYIRYGDSCGCGRYFPAKKGIIGKAYTDRKPKVENFQDLKEYRTQMVNKYGYTVEEAERISSDRRSYLCYPILDEKNSVLGLLYFDSDKPGSFSLDNDHELIRMVCSGMEAFKANLI